MSTSPTGPALVLLAALTAAGCSHDEGRSRAATMRASADQPGSVATATDTAASAVPATPDDAAALDPTGRDAAAPVSGTGAVTFLAAVRDVDVFARTPGVLRRVDVTEGVRVGSGARLAEVEDDAQRLLLREREAEVDTAQAAFARADGLHAQKLLPESEYLSARATLAIARARRDQARLDLDRCTIRAPISGLVSVCRAQVGQTVQPGTLLFRVTDPDRLRAELLLPEEERGRVRAGAPVTLTPIAGGRAVPARVTRVNPVVDAASGTFRVAIELDNRALRLPPGTSVRCRFDGAALARAAR